MSHRLPCVLLIAAVLSVAIGHAQQPAPVFRARGELVRVFVTVTDRDGRLVANLAQNAFEARDDGSPQPIVLFDNTPQPIRLVVLLDVSGSMEGNLELLREAADELFTRLRPDDLARVGSFGEKITISETFTHSVAELRDALPETITPDAPTPLWRALDQAMTAFGKDVEERKAILVLTDGKDTDMGFGKMPMSQGGVIDRARAEDVMIYAIGLRSRPRHTMAPGLGPSGLRAAMLDDLPDPGLARVAEETGGGYTEIRPTEDLAEAFARVADELHAQYLLGYAPPKRDGKVHKIEVKMTEKNLKARSRRSYLAPK